MTLDELIGKVPESLRPVAAQYGPGLVKMTADEVWAWVQLLIEGKTAEAYQAVVDKLPAADKLAMTVTNIDKWNEVNAANAANIALQKDAAGALLKALLTVALAMVGL